MIDETRAVAKLPHLEVEIWHRRLPEGQAEQLAISLKATPSFGEVATVLAATPWPWAPHPWLLWSQMMRAAWQPRLAALHGGMGRAQPVPTPGHQLCPGAGSDGNRFSG